MPTKAAVSTRMGTPRPSLPPWSLARIGKAGKDGDLGARPDRSRSLDCLQSAGRRLMATAAPSRARAARKSSSAIAVSVAAIRAVASALGAATATGRGRRVKGA
jgi:hypothetical protein